MSKTTLSAAQKLSRVQCWQDRAPEYLSKLLDAYSSWLFFERHFLHVGRFGAERAMGLIDTVMTDNIGAAIQVPADHDLPDYAAPARRAALVLGAAGLKVDVSLYYPLSVDKESHVRIPIWLDAGVRRRNSCSGGRPQGTFKKPTLSSSIRKG